MTRSALDPDQRKLVALVEGLRFGVVERLSIRGGSPCYEPAPRVIQTVKLDSVTEPQPDLGAELTLKKEFENLFDYLSRLGDATVDIEIRHSAPFRLVLEHRCEALLSK
jgi:hypothetical protein